MEGFDLNKGSVKKEYLKQLEFQQLQFCKEVSVLEPFTLPTLELTMDKDQSFVAFILKQQNRTMWSEHPVLLDFKAPLELEIILLRDAQM